LKKNPKAESRKPEEARIPKIEPAAAAASDFGIRIGFGFRHWACGLRT
jgi:hypothetical protein